MGRAPRHWDSNHYYFVTNRVHNGRFLFRPDTKFNRLALGCLAYYAKRYGIKIICFVFMSNHFHLVLQDPRCQMSNFMRDFQRTLSHRVKELRQCTEVVFSRRFRASPLLDEAALREKIAYTLTNPIKDRLVTHLEDWPGINSWLHHTSGKPMVGKFYKKSNLRQIKRQNPDISDEKACQKATDSHPITFEVPSCFSGDTSEERRESLVQFVEEYRSSLRKSFSSKTVIGRKKILRRSWNHVPKTLESTSCPPCHCSCPKLRLQYLNRRRSITDQYRKSISKLRDGQCGVEFPVGTIPPGWNRCYTREDAGVDPPTSASSG